MKKLLMILVFAFLFVGCANTHTVTVTYEPNGGSILNMTSTVNSNSPQWYPLTPNKLNSYFVNWYLDSEFSVLYSPDALLENDEITLYAKYIEVDQEDFYLVAFVAVGGTFTPNQLIPSGGLLVAPSIPIIEGYTFLYWEYVNSMSNKQGEVNFLEPITEHLTLEAIYSTNNSYKTS